ncbi:unnamed protein product [Owenia fusiformis]|uniref:Uncharacterized protein n=1 Tax=Owenia fusiformis TaxID=6347 RepID=A0A8J1V120_OWEFU|nr:unnamed protein product [Owenia fusiformis]
MMEHLFRAILITVGARIYAEGLLCPVGYNLVRHTLVVDSENLTWSEAAIECTRKNGRIFTVMDNQSEQIFIDIMEEYSLGKAWVVYTGNIKDELDESDLKSPFYIMKDISDKKFDASSRPWGAKYAKINSESAWFSFDLSGCQWVRVDLGKPMCIYGIVTKGRKYLDRWTSVYKLNYKNDVDKNFITLQDDGKEELTANEDNDTPVYRNFTKPFNARFIRLYPKLWNIYPAIRFDLLVSNNSCPKEFPCGKCPAIINIPTSNATVQYESCCSKLPYVCETKSCVPDQKESSATITDSTIDNDSRKPEIQKEFSTLATIKDSAVVDNTTNYRSASNSAFSCVLCSMSLTIGLIIGMVLLVIIIIILLILLILSQRRKKYSQNASKSAVPAAHKIDKNKNEINRSVAKVSQNVTLTDPKDLYTQIDIKTKHKKSEMIYANMGAYNAAYDTTTDDTTTNDTATYNTISDDAKDTTLYHTPEDIGVYSFEKHTDDKDIPDGIEMFNNELYSDI